MKIVANATLRKAEVKKLFQRETAPSLAIEKIVRDILMNIKSKGMSAVLEYAEKFDGLKGKLSVSEKELAQLADQLDSATAAAIKKAIRKVKIFHQKQMEKSWRFKGVDGEILGQNIRPLKRVGLYIPGGAGAYPSTVIMNAIPALVAGVDEIVAVTPNLSVEVAYTLKTLGVREIYKIGGAQAIGLLAYGAGKVLPVDKIVGPGNVYQAVAKKEVFGICDIDMIAGPSEILVLADRSADPDWVAADLLSQAEHGSGYEAAVLITPDNDFAQWVQSAVIEQVESSPKKALLQKTLDQYGRILVVKDWETALEISDAIAPEHLEIIAENEDELATRVQNAGAIFVGAYSSEPVGDYLAGPNHVLPTNGTARFASPLGVYDFLKRTSYIKYNRKALLANGKAITAIADREGFFHHGMAIRKRMI